MAAPNKKRHIDIISGFIPCEPKDGDETWNVGIFHFNIGRMIEDIRSGRLSVLTEEINVEEWFRNHGSGSINEEHMSDVKLSEPVIQAEVSPGRFEIIDGNHRMEKARREGIQFIDSYKLAGHQLPHYLTDNSGYSAYIGYWNDKLQE